MEIHDFLLYTKADLVNALEVTAEQAAINTARGKGPREAKPAHVGWLKVSDAQLDRMVADGYFPRPRKIAKRAIRWLGRDIREWMEALPYASPADLLPTLEKENEDDLT